MKKLLGLGLLLFGMGQVIGVPTPTAARNKVRMHACVPFCTAMGDSVEIGDSFEQCKIDCEFCVQENPLLPGVVKCLEREATPTMRAQRATEARKAERKIQAELQAALRDALARERKEKARAKKQRADK